MNSSTFATLYWVHRPVLSCLLCALFNILQTAAVLMYVMPHFKKRRRNLLSDLVEVFIRNQYVFKKYKTFFPILQVESHPRAYITWCKHEQERSPNPAALACVWQGNAEYSFVFLGHQLGLQGRSVHIRTYARAYSWNLRKIYSYFLKAFLSLNWLFFFLIAIIPLWMERNKVTFLVVRSSDTSSEGRCFKVPNSTVVLFP